MKEAVGQPVIEPPGSVCANSCQYAFGFTPASNVYVYSSGNPPGVFGVYSYTGNGIECNEDTRKEPGNPGQQTDPDETPTPDPDNKCPDGYVWNGTFCSKEPPKPCDPEVEVGGCDGNENPDPDNPGDGDGEGDGDGDGDGDGSGDGGTAAAMVMETVMGQETATGMARETGMGPNATRPRTQTSAASPA